MRPKTGIGYPLKLHYFPRPYPNEVIGSLLIRACRHWGLSIKQFNRVVLGVASSHLPMLMSAHLPRLAELTGVSSDVLLDQHTVFPYVTAFLTASQVTRLRHQLLTTLEDGLKPLAALIQSATTPRIGWRFCATCSALDIRDFGETYWRLPHLLPGVLVCQDHGEMLLEACPQGNDRLALPFDAKYRQTSWLLGQEKMMLVAIASRDCLGDPVRESSSVTYRRLADDAGYRITMREIAAQQLSHDLGAYYGEPFLTQFGCDLTRSPASHWPGLMVRHSVAGPFVPLKHVLLRVYLEQAPSGTKEIHRKQAGRTPRDYLKIDGEVATALMEAIVRLNKHGKTINASDLLKQIGAWHIYRHNRHAMPKTKAAIESYRRSPQHG